MVVLVGVVVYLNSDIRATTLTTGASLSAPSTPASVPTTVQPAWTARTDPSLGVVVSPAGVVVTTDPHGITAHDSTTGAVRWTYTRVNRTLCQVAGLMTRPLKTAADAPESVDTAGSLSSTPTKGFCSQIETFLARTAPGQSTAVGTAPDLGGGTGPCVTATARPPTRAIPGSTERHRVI